MDYEKSPSLGDPLRSAINEIEIYFNKILASNLPEDCEDCQGRDILRAMTNARDQAVAEYRQANLEMKLNDDAGLPEMNNIIEKFSNCLKQESSIIGYKLRLLLGTDLETEFPISDGKYNSTLRDFLASDNSIRIDIDGIDNSYSGIDEVDYFKARLSDIAVNNFRLIANKKDPRRVCIDFFESAINKGSHEYLEEVESVSDQPADIREVVERDRCPYSLKNQIHYLCYMFQGFNLYQAEVNRHRPASDR